MSQMDTMPKARPLPRDPAKRAKLIQRRKTTCKAVQAWRLRNPAKRRLLGRTVIALWRKRQAGRRAYRLTA